MGFGRAGIINFHAVSKGCAESDNLDLIIFGHSAAKVKAAQGEALLTIIGWTDYNN